MTPDECLSAAWTYCAPMRAVDKDLQPGVYDFPRGFWPDVARVAIAMFEQQTDNPILDFRPTKCARGNSPALIRKSKLGVDLGRLEIKL